MRAYEIAGGEEMAGKRDPVQIMAGMLLGVTALCSVALLCAAGTSAVEAFAGQKASVQRRPSQGCFMD